MTLWHDYGTITKIIAWYNLTLTSIKIFFLSNRNNFGHFVFVEFFEFQMEQLDNFLASKMTTISRLLHSIS